jgi:AraC-like DNA-binding protein
MELSLHFLTNVILLIVCFAMGTIFIVLPTPQKPSIIKYKISLKVLASAYFLLAILTLLILTFKLSDNAREHLTFTSISISSFQAFLFTFALIALLVPQFITVKNIALHILPYFILTILFTVSYSIYGNPVLTHFNEIRIYITNPTLWVRLLFYGFYIFQLLFYTWLYFHFERKYKAGVMNYFSDDLWIKISWVRWAFLSALSVGVISMFSYVFHQKYDWIFTVIFSVFYFGFAIEYIKYNKIFDQIEPVVIEDAVEEPLVVLQPIFRQKTDWNRLKNQIIENQYYLEPGINIEEMARRLNIGRTTLSTFINRDEGMNFNTWVNKLRIEKAKEMLLESPDEPLSSISEKVGYSEQANFSRQFKQMTGYPPTLWRQKQEAC